MNPKFAFVMGTIMGGLGIYAWSLKQQLAMQKTISELNKPPRRITQQDWWENHQPNTDDEYQVTLARRNWLRYFFSNFIYPYVDRNASSVLVQEFIMPHEEKLTRLELEQQDKERLTALRQIQRAGQTDD
jgi:hypothetical protein